jgi:hypothetical protein
MAFVILNLFSFHFLLHFLYGYLQRDHILKYIYPVFLLVLFYS